MSEDEIRLERNLRGYEVHINGALHSIPSLCDVTKDLIILKHLLSFKRMKLVDNIARDIFDFKEGASKYLKIYYKD